MKHAHLLLVMLVIGLLFAACSKQRVPTTSPAAQQLVIAAHSTYAGNNNINIWTSTDATAWDGPKTVDSSNTPMQTIAAPSIVSDGFLYHLIWMAPNGHIKYATSGNLLQWIIQSDPLARFSPSINAEFFQLAQGSGKFLAIAWGNGEAIVHNLSSSALRSRISSVYHASITFGNGKFIVAKTGSDGAVDVLESTDGARWSMIGGHVLPPFQGSRTARISFSEGRFFLAVTTSGVSADPAVPRVDCKYFESRDNGSTWTEVATAPCANDIHYLSQTFFQGKNMLFMRTGVLAEINVSVNFGSPWRSLGSNIGGRFTVVTGPKPAR